MTGTVLGAADPTAVLTGLYAALALLLLSLQLKSGWRWPVKSAAIGLSLPASLGVFWAIDAQLGWPSPATLPERFQLHAALIEEPTARDGQSGAIYLWLSPWDQPADDGILLADEPGLDAAMLPDRRPRAFDLPYSRELHQQVETMRERLARGEMVTGRHEPGNGWQRRFGQHGGRVDLEAPPPPPMPAKED